MSSSSTSVSLEFIGEAPAEKSGSVVSEILRELTIRTMPRDLPSHIDIDLSVLVNVGDSITVADVVLPAGVTAVADPDEVIANVSEAKEQAEDEEVATEIDMDAIAVEQKGKGEGEESAE